jgi:hypothetical protein
MLQRPQEFAIHNLRSVLDHLAWALAPKPTTKTDFPIWLKPRTTKGRPRLAGISGVGDHHVQQIVEAVQPYHQPNPAESYLWLLDQFDIIDKHKLLLTTFCVATGTAHSIEQMGENAPEIEYLWDQLGDGQTFARVKFDSPVADFSANFSITLEVAIRPEGSNVVYPLKNTVFLMSQEVAKTVNMFNAFL